MAKHVRREWTVCPQPMPRIRGPLPLPTTRRCQAARSSPTAFACAQPRFLSLWATAHSGGAPAPPGLPALLLEWDDGSPCARQFALARTRGIGELASRPRSTQTTSTPPRSVCQEQISMRGRIFWPREPTLVDDDRSWAEPLQISAGGALGFGATCDCSTCCVGKRSGYWSRRSSAGGGQLWDPPSAHTHVRLPVRGHRSWGAWPSWVRASLRRPRRWDMCGRSRRRIGIRSRLPTIEAGWRRYWRFLGRPAAALARSPQVRSSAFSSGASRYAGELG